MAVNSAKIPAIFLIEKFPKAGQHFVAQHNFAERVKAVALRSIFIDHHVALLCTTAVNGQLSRLEYLKYAALFFLQASPTS